MAALLSSDDDDLEPQLRAVEGYYFVDDDDAPVPFHVLPFQLDAAEKVPSFTKDVYLRGFTDAGLRKVYKQVVAWRVVLDGDSPEITVLSTEGSWVTLMKPRPSYEETVRSVLVTVEMLHFVRNRPTEAEKGLWEHLRGVFERFLVRPSEDDFRNHQMLIKLFAERDPGSASSKILQAFIKEKTMENISEVSSNNMETKPPFIAAADEIEEMIEDDSIQEPNNDDDDEEDEEDGELFDSVCAICDNGGELLCCEGPCMRSFHGKKRDGEDSYCATLGYTKAEVKAIRNFLCKNCEHKQHQCFVCGELEPSDGLNAKVFLCNNATCGHFYHPKCVAQLLHPNNRNEASELDEKIVAGFSFTCPVHWCFRCKGLEDRTQEPLQFAVCRRCPRSYHRKCLPREISFEETNEHGIITRAWELSKRILIYCLDHAIDLDLGTPSRDHIKFPHPEKAADSVKKKVKELAGKKRRNFDDPYVYEPLQKPAKLRDKFNAKDGETVQRAGMKSSFEGHVFGPEKKKTKNLKGTTHPEASFVARAASVSSPKHVREHGKELGLAPGKTQPQSSFPIVDSEIEKRVRALVEKEVSSLTLADSSRRCAVPSTYVSSGRQIDKIIARGKLERSVQALQAALQKLENGGTVNDAKAVCEPEVLRQLTKWNNKLRVYLSPFLHGMRYTSFGRHFTKKEKLIEIVDKLHWYVQPGDTIVDFSCGTNDFSQFMKEKLETVGKRCNFKNYDVIQPKNSFCFEKRDWMTVRPNELPHGSKLIMGLNPPFGSKAVLANKFIDKALTFKPKLIILIAPKEAERLDRKRQPYDLVWEDNQRLSGKSFYLPGCLDVSDKQIDQWNRSPPPLYLWSRSDCTLKHKKIAEEHGHSEAKVFNDAKELSSDNNPLHSLCEVTYDQNSTSREEKELHLEENSNFVAGEPAQVEIFPPEKLVEVAYEETKVTSNRSDHREERDAHSDLKVAWCNDSRTSIHVSNISTGRRESEKVKCDDVKADSDMSISPSGSRNSQQQSRNCEPPVSSESEYPSHHDNCFNNLVSEHCTSPVTFEDSYFRNVSEYGAASIENVAFSADNAGACSRMYSPDPREMTGLYAGDPTGNPYRYGRTGSSFYGSQNLQGHLDYTMENSCSAQMNPVPGREMQGNSRRDDYSQTGMDTPSTDIRAQIRMYGGQIRDDHTQTAMNLPATDIRAQIRMYGRQSNSGHPNAGRYSSGFSDARFDLALPSSYGMSSMGSTGRSVIDKYTPSSDETNYSTGQRGPYNASDFGRDVRPDPLNFASHQQYYPRPGSSGGWLG